MKKIKVIIILALVFFIVYPLGAEVGDVNPDSPSPGDPGDLFQGESPSEMNKEDLKKGTFVFSSCGEKDKIDGYEIKPGVVLIPLGDGALKKILKNFNTTAEYDGDSKIITFTRGKDKTIRMKIDYSVVDYCGEKKSIPTPPRIIDQVVYVSPDSFAKLIWASFLYDDKKEIYYIDPWVLDVYLQTNNRGRVQLVAKATGPVKNRILKLREPTRFVIDVMNSCLDGKSREINHPTLGAIRFSQNSLKGDEGNIVRIVIPQSEEVEIVMQESEDANLVIADLRPRDTLTPVQGLGTQTVERLDVREKSDSVEITLETTGPIQLEWNRLLDPDNRFFIDIPGLVYKEKKKQFELESQFLPKIMVAQFQPQPSPMVRIVLYMESPQKIEIKEDKQNPNLVKFIVYKEKIDPAKSARKGFFVTYYPTTGLVICLDPGHGGSDPGAVNSAQKVYEKTVTLDIALRLKQLLVKEGWTVVMTRYTDRDVSYPGSPDLEELESRVIVGNDLRADIFVSIHINASVKSSVNGISTHWYKAIDKPLAEAIQSSLIQNLGQKDLGERRDRFYVLHRAKMPAVLIELGFISNADEVKLLKDEKYRQKAAEAIMSGLRNYAVKNLQSTKKSIKQK